MSATECIEASIDDLRKSSLPSELQKAVMSACEVGDILRLQDLLQGAGVRQGDPPVDPQYIRYPDIIEAIPSSGPPATPNLVIAALENKQHFVLEYLLKIYPELDVEHDAILLSAFVNPDLKCIEVLHTHCPSIVNFEFQSHSSAIIEALRAPDTSIATYLLDNGADPNEGGLGAMGPLFHAIIWDKPLEIIQKMVECGAIVRPYLVIQAIEQQHPQIIKYLIYQCWMESPADVLKAARKTKNKEIVSMVEKRIRNGKELQESEKVSLLRVKRWWETWR